MAKATKKAAPKKAAVKEGGTKKRRSSGPGRSSGSKNVPHGDAPSISLAKDESDYSQE